MMKKKLFELGKIVTGNTPKTSDINNYSSNDIPFVKPSDLAENELSSIDKTEFWISEYARKKARVLPPKSILVTCIGIIGKVGINTVECAFNQQINAIVPDFKICLPKYIAYEILYKQRQLQDIANAPVVPIINKTQFSNIEVETPCVEIQTKVVFRLDKISGIIQSQKKALAKLDELIKSRFVEMFGDPVINLHGWDVITLAGITKNKACNGFFARRDEYVTEGNARVLGVTNIVNRMYSNVVNLPQVNATDIDIIKYKVEYGDMLFCRSSLVAEGIGKASIVPKGLTGNILFECHVIRLPLDVSKCVPEYIQVLSTTNFFRNQIIAQSKTATMTTIGQEEILKTNIILPPLELQYQFTDFVKHVNKQKSAVQKSIEKLEILKKSLMQEYFG